MSFHIFPIQSIDLEGPKRELEFWITETIKRSNLAEVRLKEWFLDFFVNDPLDNTFDSLIMMENYPLSESAKSPKLDRLICLKSKLKKYQEYADNSKLI